jgi:hypothetical protein
MFFATFSNSIRISIITKNEMKMKKVAYLMTLVLALTLVSTSCCKDDDPIVPDTLSKLNGAWNFQSLTYDNGAGVNVFDTPAELADLNLTKDFVQLDFDFNVGNMTVKLSTTYTGTNENGTGNWSGTYPFTFSTSDNIIDIDGGYLKFQLISNDGTTLKLKLTKGNGDMPIGGTYTLIK